MTDDLKFDFEETIRLLATGLCEREQTKTEDDMNFSGKLRSGISRLAVLASEYSLDSIAFHETMFIKNYACKPVREWFHGWSEEYMDTIRQSEYYNLGELVVLSGSNRFELTDDCIELLSTVEDDIIFGEEQRNVYQKLYSLTPELYSKTREFLVMNPVCTEETLRDFKLKYAENSVVSDVISFAYELVQKQSYRCPSCGWTMTFSGMQAACCNRSCTKNMPSETDFAAEDIIPAGVHRLRRGVMRYIAVPGRLELAIRDKAEKLGYTTELYPEKDKYDIKITGAGRSIAVDAKTHHNPYLLKKQIEGDNSLAVSDCSEAYYVVPDEYEKSRRGFCEIAQGSSKTECITVKQLFRILKGGA